MTTDKARKRLERDAIEVGCFGLVDGWARNYDTGEWFSAELCRKDDGPFVCPECHSDAVVKKCTEKIDHFAHKARLTPVIGAEESLLHWQCKDEICEELKKRFPSGNWATERTIPENKRRGLSQLVPDISGRVGNQRLAIEVQISALTITKILKRTGMYAARGIPILWVVPLSEPLGELPFRPRLYERYLHSLYFGRTYYWWPGLGLTLKPVHYAIAMRHVEWREWFEDGEEREAGGYEVPYKIVKSPLYGRDLDLARDFYRHARPRFTPENERKEVPKSLIWRDRLREWWNAEAQVTPRRQR